MELISRQKAIDIADRECQECRGIFGRIEEAIKALPLIESRPKGKWIEDTGLYATCSNCKENLYQAIEYKFCPNCGADMGGEK